MNEDNSEKAKATFGIQAVGWMGVSPPLMKVFIDGRVVGLLRDMTVHEYPVAPGRHEGEDPGQQKENVADSDRGVLSRPSQSLPAAKR